MEFVIRGLLEHRFLHADPNFANYAFLEDGRLIVYDHGCMKEIPEALADQYRRVLATLLDGDLEALPLRLQEMGIFKKKSNRPIPRKILDPMAREAVAIVGAEPFRFSNESKIYEIAFDVNGQFLRELTDVGLPPDMVMVNRSLGGLFGNLCRLEACGRWRDLLMPYVR
jgi:predicted unusual protein kinase regulating ubiquinone biosynthesis (AarF/ABC1/UbiB family)